MKVLVIGAGGREHALCWKIRQSPLVREIVAAPGNDGMRGVARCEAVSAEDIAGLVQLAERERPDLVMVGPEAPLCAGLADRLRERGFLVAGPSAAAARLEGSKAFSKEVMAAARAPTAAFNVFDSAEDAMAFVRRANRPFVVKADGLAAGKGVIVPATAEETIAGIRQVMIDRVVGDAGARVVLEEKLSGPELSFLVFTDGERVVPLAPSRDHKRLRDGGQGPNTGGMGTVCPTPNHSSGHDREWIDLMIRPVLREMKARGAPYQGVLYAGLMLTRQGPMLLEFNCRFGDPETQVLMLQLESDLVPWLAGMARGELPAEPLKWREGVSVCVVLAAENYPGTPVRGAVIEGLREDGSREDVVVFHAGTRRDEQGRFVTHGGRVLNLCAHAETMDEALSRVYRAAAEVRFPGAQFRTDIGRPGDE
ncbi:MAG: Phosphoribosylamine--glycine ligase [Myxococcota bacterium]|nr:Phosphoribosylamine--glycine ligase [Myxococcota bacterium]